MRHSLTLLHFIIHSLAGVLCSDSESHCQHQHGVLIDSPMKSLENLILAQHQLNTLESFFWFFVIHRWPLRLKWYRQNVSIWSVSTALTSVKKRVTDWEGIYHFVKIKVRIIANWMNPLWLCGIATEGTEVQGKFELITACSNRLHQTFSFVRSFITQSLMHWFEIFFTKISASLIKTLWPPINRIGPT